MTDDPAERLDDHRCPDCNEDLEFVRPSGMGMGRYECPGCEQQFVLKSR